MAKNDKTSRDVALQDYFAQSFIAYMKTLVVHWNYEGDNFFGIHKMTEAQYLEIASANDAMAERMRALGHAAPVSLAQILGEAKLPEFKSPTSGTAALQELAKSNRALAKLARTAAETAEESGDPFTHDLLVHRSGTHEKYAWMIESAAE